MSHNPTIVMGTGNAKGSNVTLRDYFAAKALQALIATCPDGSYTGHAMNAYDLADAMLRVRAQ